MRAVRRLRAWRRGAMARLRRRPVTWLWWSSAILAACMTVTSARHSNNAMDACMTPYRVSIDTKFQFRLQVLHLIWVRRRHRVC